MNLVEVIHPLTGKVMRLHPHITADGIWLPPDANDLTDETVAELRAALDVTSFTKAIVRLALSQPAAEVKP